MEPQVYPAGRARESGDFTKERMTPARLQIRWHEMALVALVPGKPDGPELGGNAC
jgi:hypothetical protein